MTVSPDAWEQVEERVVSRYPYPLAATFNRAFSLPQDDTEAHDYLLDLVWATLKHLAAIVVAQYLRDGSGDPKVNQSLAVIERPSLGHWGGWLRDIVALYRRQGRPLVIPELDALLQHRQDGQILTAAQRLLGELHSMGSEFAPKGSGWTTEDVLWLIIGYRNRIAAGRGGSDAALRGRVAKLLAPAMAQLYGQMGFLADYRLAFVRGITLEIDPQGAYRYRHALTYLVGHTPKVAREPLVLSQPFRYGEVYLLDRHAESEPLLSLHPLVVHAPCPGCGDRDQTFILNGGDPEALDFVSYQCAHHLRRTDCARDLHQLIATLGTAPIRPRQPPTRPRPRLTVTTDGQELTFDGSREIRLGRDPTSDVRFLDPRVSRSHAAIRFDDGAWVLEDTGSRFGTFRDGQAVTRHRFSVATTLRLGAEDGPLVELRPLPGDAVPEQPLRTTDLRPPEPPVEIPPTPSAALDSPAAGAGAAMARPQPAMVVQPPSNGPPPTAAVSAVATGPPAPPITAVGDAPATGPATSVGSSPAETGGLPVQRERVAIGRSQDNDIVVADPLVSRHHAELRWQPPAGYQLSDLGSLNGTFVNGRQISNAAPVADGDLISFGRQRFRIARGTLQPVASGDLGLEVQGVTVRTPEGKVLLDRVSFPLEKHSFLAVVGPSGAGKTTLIGAMTGFNPASEGTVYYGGRDLYADYDELRRSIGYVPQDDIIHTQLTVRQALSYTAELRFPPDVSAEERSHRVDEVMAELGLSERADLVIERLSGGQRKRANIGVELLTSPSPLFLDEPTSGLDPGMEKGVMTLLRQLADGGRTVIIVTHSQQSLHLCDRVLFLAPGGRAAFFGPPGDALQYFGRTDFADIFTDLEQRRDIAWNERFQASSECETYVRQPLADREIQSTARELPTAVPRPPGVWRHQAWTLTRRYLSAIAADRRNLALLLLQAPVLALLMIAALGSGAFQRPPTGGPNPLAQMVVTVAVLTITLTGLLNSIREIVKEFPIYRRERFVGLSIGAYVASKVAVLAPLVVLQALVLTLLGLARQPVDGSAPVLGSPAVELVVDLSMTGLAAMALGLLVSATMRSSDKAISVLVLLVVAQLVMSMPVLEVWTKPVLGQISWLSSANWGVDSMASTVNLNSVQPPQGGANPAWVSSAGTWLASFAVLLLLTVGAVAATGWLLRRRDPSLLAAPRRRRGPAAEPAVPALPPQPA